MKKHLLPITLALLLMLSQLAGCSATRRPDTAKDTLEQNSEQSVTDRVTSAPDSNLHFTPTPDQLTQAQAIEIALAHAGFTEDSVQYLHTNYEIDDRIPQYDVSFRVNNMEYEYEIHAETGEILSFDADN